MFFDHDLTEGAAYIGAGALTCYHNVNLADETHVWGDLGIGNWTGPATARPTARGIFFGEPTLCIVGFSEAGAPQLSSRYCWSNC